jgi:CMP-N,N'-diacetyllegionaminic acid synthase
MSILCVIGARGGSQGLPGKNIRPLLGKPLIVWSIEQAQAVPEIGKIVVSTDSPAIAEVARGAGALVPFLRPPELAGPTIGKFQVWQHALSECRRIYSEDYECYVDLDCTSPLRDPADISNCIAKFRHRRAAGVDAVFTVCNARKNPYFNLVEAETNGALKVSKALPNKILGRQAAPTVLEHVASIYVLATKYIENATHLLDGHAEGYDIGEAKSLDVDSELDFELIEFLMKRKRQGLGGKSNAGS